MEESYRSKIVWTIIAGALLLLGLLGLSFAFLHTEASKHPITTELVDTTVATGYIDIDVRPIQIDPLRHTLIMEITLNPHGTLLEGDGAVSVPITLRTNTSHTPYHFFAPHTQPQPLRVSFNLHDATVENYPFDHYRASMSLHLSSPDQSIPTQINFHPFHEDFSIDTALHAMEYDFIVHRSWIVQSLAIFWVLMIWALTLINMIILIGVLLERIRPTVWVVGYLHLFVVGVYLFRDLFPQIPPFFGVLSDFVSIFWAMLVTILVALIVTYRWFLDLRYSTQ